MTKATQDWRNDPERLGAAAALYIGWMAGRNRALVHIEAALKEFEAADLDWDDSTARMLKESKDHLYRALWRAKDAASKPPSGIYLGNMAAFGVGTDRNYKNRPEAQSEHDCMDEWFDN